MTLTIEEKLAHVLDGTTPDDTQNVSTEENVEEDVENVMVPDTSDKNTPEDTITSHEDVATPPETTPVAVVDAPVALTGAIKEKWATLPEDVQREWKKREDDIQRMMTSHDGELRMGRSIKEIASPYMATIQAEGGTVEGAFKDLLNTSYILRTGSPHQKAQVMMQAIQQFGVDLNLAQQAQQNPQLAQLQEEIHRLKQANSPQVIENQLQERLEQDRIANEIRDFAANPKNVHFQTVRADMGALMTSGRAKDLQEAYEMACWANPSIRAANLTAQAEQDKAKRKTEMEAKRKASASVVGSPSGTSPSAHAPNKSLEDEIRDNIRASSGYIN